MAASSAPAPSGLSGMGESMAYSYGPTSMGTSMMPAAQQSMWGQQVAGSWLPPSTEYVINACGRDFPKMDGMFRKADPFLQVWAPAAAGGQRRLVFKSEVVKQNLNPQWRSFTISAAEAGGESIPLTWEAWDWDEDGSNDYIGQFTATLEQINSQPKFTFLNPDRKGTFGRKRKATVGEFHLLSVRKQQGQPKRVPAKVRLNLRGEKLAIKDVRTSDPYLVVWGQPLPSASGLPEDRDRAAATATQRKFVVIAKTEVVDSNLNPVWQPIEIPLELSGGLDAKIGFECWDFDDDGSHDSMGTCYTSLRELMQPDPQIPLIEIERKGGLGYKNSGYLRVVLAEEIPVPDYPEPPTVAYDFDVSCSKLARMDLNGKSDPFIQISTYLPRAPTTRVTIFKSEVIYKVLAGTFKRFQLSVVDCGGLDNLLNFEVYDKDPKGQEIIGGFRTTLRELTMIKNNRHFLKNPKHMSKFSGIITINSCMPAQSVQEAMPQAPQYKINCAAHGITRQSSAFTIFAGTGSAGAPLFRSNTVPGKNPVYEAVTLDTAKCGGIDGPLLIEFSNPNETGRKSALIGNARTTLRELYLSCKNKAHIPVINAKHAKKMPGYKASADFEIQMFEPISAPAAPGGWGHQDPAAWAGGPPSGGPPSGGPGGPPGGPPGGGWGPPPPWAGQGGPSSWGPPPPWAGQGGPSSWGPPPPWAGGQSGWGQPPPWAYQQSGWGGPPAGWGQGPPPSGGPPAGWGQGPPPSGDSSAAAGGPPSSGGWGPPPSSGGPPSGGWGQGPPPSGDSAAGGPPPAGGWGPPPSGGGPPSGGPPSGGWGPPPPSSSGGPPSGGWGQPSWGGPPTSSGGPQSSWGGPPPTGDAPK